MSGSVLELAVVGVEDPDAPRKPEEGRGCFGLLRAGRAGDLDAIPTGFAAPRSPFVRISRCTSRPSDPQRANEPPAQISASSGWANTASTGPPSAGAG